MDQDDGLFDKLQTIDNEKHDINNSDKKKKYHVWTMEQEKLLLEGVKQFGKKWDQIQEQFLQSLTPAQLKNKYYAMQKSSSSSRPDSHSASQIETSSRSIPIGSFEQQQPQKRPKKQDEDDWLNFNIMQELDFLDYDEFMK